MPIVPKTKAEIEVSVWDPLSNQNLGFEVNRMLAKIHSELVKMPLWVCYGNRFGADC